MNAITRTKAWIKVAKQAKRLATIRSNKAHCSYMAEPKSHNRTAHAYCVAMDLNQAYVKMIDAMKELIEKAERQEKELKTIRFLAKEVKQRKASIAKERAALAAKGDQNV